MIGPVPGTGGDAYFERLWAGKYLFDPTLAEKGYVSSGLMLSRVH